MKDIALDDLIKKDKEAKKTKNIKGPNKNNGNQGPKRLKKGKVGNPKDKNTNQPKKHKKIQKQKPQPQPVQRQAPAPAPVPKPDERKLRVLGLHPDVKNEELYELFAKEGALDMCRVDQDNFGRSMTTATVVYHNVDSARQAVRNLNKQTLRNSILTVEHDRRVERKAGAVQQRPIKVKQQQQGQKQGKRSQNEQGGPKKFKRRARVNKKN